ncbi:MAG: Cobalamin synthase [Ktedonobacterales bacterium]|jgi:adenosylcobinamide-GDP ribazoletransferase|nr:MAG: Cobalamin synthase [Ktedonobacterales bacterium]
MNHNGPNHTPAHDKLHPQRRGGPFDGLALALQFLMILPVRSKRANTTLDGPPEMAAALPWFPVVGALLGGLLALTDWALTPLFAANVRNVALLALAALLTGMLHLDGFIDCCDGLLGTRTIERRLEILRDSRVGAYGVIGGVLLVLAQFAALGALPASMRLFALVAALLLGRWAMVYAVVAYPYARATGAGAGFHAGGRHLALATLATLATLALLASASLLLPGGWWTPSHFALAGAVALVALVVALGWARWASHRLGGGLTGDTYGALNELVTLAVLALLPPLAHLLVRLA